MFNFRTKIDLLICAIICNLTFNFQSTSIQHEPGRKIPDHCYPPQTKCHDHFLTPSERGYRCGTWENSIETSSHRPVEHNQRLSTFICRENAVSLHWRDFFQIPHQSEPKGPIDKEEQGIKSPETKSRRGQASALNSRNHEQLRASWKQVDSIIG